MCTQNLCDTNALKKVENKSVKTFYIFNKIEFIITSEWHKYKNSSSNIV